MELVDNDGLKYITLSSQDSKLWDDGYITVHKENSQYVEFRKMKDLKPLNCKIF